MKYKNKIKDLEKSQNFNIMEITSPGKLYSRNPSKISNGSKLMNASTGNTL